MNDSENVLAKKYALAFLNLYADAISLQDYHAIKAAADYFKKNSKFFFLLNTPKVSLETKRTTLITLLQQLAIPHSVEHLIELVLKHQRLFLIPTIFMQLVVVYEQRNNIVQFTISSSHKLEKNQLETLKTFIAKKTGASIVYKEHVNKKLIAGIRMQSNVFLWEYSIAKQLQAIRKTIR